MVAHQGGEHPQRQPPQQQIPAGVGVEATQVGSHIQETAHIEGGQHLEVQQQVAPPGVVVAGPDAAVPVHPDAGRPGEQQKPFARGNAGQPLRGGPGHVVAVEVVDLVVADHFAVHLVIKAGVVFRRIGQIEPADGLAKMIDGAVFMGNRRMIQPLGQPLPGIEDGGLVHVVPEALDAAVGQSLVLAAEPGPGLGVQHVGEVAPPRPDGSLKIGSVGPLAEVALFLALVADRIACFLLDAGVDDGHQPDALLFHLGYKAGKIGEFLRVDGEVLVVVHVVDVHVHHVQGNVGLAVFGHHFFKVGLGLVAVAALAKAKGKFGRDVAAADDGPELLDHIAGAVAGDDVKGQVGPLTGDFQPIPAGEADVKPNPGGIVEEQPQILLARDHDEVVGGVHSLLVFGVEAVVHIVADVDKAPLVDAAVGFAQAVDPVALRQGAGKAEAGLAGFDRSHRGFALACRDWCDHRFGIKGDTIEILLNHTVLPNKSD